MYLRSALFTRHLFSALLFSAVLFDTARAQPEPDPAYQGPFVVFLTHAVGLAYDDPGTLARQLYKRKRFKRGFMGHSWIYLEGREGGRRFSIDAGLSPKGDDGTQFMLGVLNLSQYGYAHPTRAQKQNPRFEPNPISFLSRDHKNGYLQTRSDAKTPPTYAARVNLTQEQYRKIRSLMDPKRPSHRSFQLNGQQCSSFVATVAALADIALEHEITVAIPSSITVAGKTYLLWTDPKYSRLTLSSPDVLERSLKQLVSQGRATDVLRWYTRELY